MYGYPRLSSLNAVRTQMLKKMVGEDERLTAKSKVELSRLPPCKDAHVLRVKRVNYRVALYKRAATPIIEKPKPYDGHGWVREGNLIEPQWSCGSIL